MYDTDMKNQFLELRGKGWSLSRIADRLKVSQRTLVDWNHQEHEQIRTLRAIECEALQEKILASSEQELISLKKELDRLEAELAKRTMQYVSTENLYRLSASGRNPQSLQRTATGGGRDSRGGVKIAPFLPRFCLGLLPLGALSLQLSWLGVNSHRERVRSFACANRKRLPRRPHLRQLRFRGFWCLIWVVPKTNRRSMAFRGRSLGNSFMGESAEPVTQILARMGAGDAQAAEKLLPLVYEELRRLAAAKMTQQPPGQTLQATALVHEAWLKLTAQEGSRWRDRQHFFRAAAEAMRQILIDRARRRLRLRHGQGQQRVALDDIPIAAPEKDEVLVQLDEALTELRAVSPERAEIVNLRFFAGLSEAEIADILRISERSVQRQWSYARAWLFARIGPGKSS